MLDRAPSRFLWGGGVGSSSAVLKQGLEQTIPANRNRSGIPCPGSKRWFLLHLPPLDKESRFIYLFQVTLCSFQWHPYLPTKHSKSRAYGCECLHTQIPICLEFHLPSFAAVWIFLLNQILIDSWCALASWSCSCSSSAA